MPDGGRGPDLQGRRREREALEGLVAGVRGGQSGVLVLRGEPGIGKTALLDHAAARASGCRLARVLADESEMELAFAALHQLCGPLLDHLDRIPPPQRAALETAFGLATGEPPDRFFVGLAVLSLLAEVAEEQPLICLVDDAHWLDRASATVLGFAARRLLAEPMAIIFGARASVEIRALDGLPEMSVGRLGDADARVVLAAGLHTPLDPAVRDRVVADADGNPLALLELPCAMTPAELAGGFGLPSTLSLSGRLEAGFARRMDELPPPTRLLLTVAAAEPVGDPLVLWRAADRLGIERGAAAPALEDGLIEISGRVVFRHPLVRSAAYRRATSAERQKVHRALVEATDAEADPDRRAWHRALAAAGPDEDVAAELERSAGRAQSRGGLAAAAALLERSAALSLDPAARMQRTLAAAAAHIDAGAAEAASALLAVAESGSLDERTRAQVELMRGFSEMTWGDTSAAATLLLTAANRLDRIDVRLARLTHLNAMGAAVTTSYLAQDTSLRDAASAARVAPAAPAPERLEDVIMDGLAMVTTDGLATAAPTLRRVLDMVRRDQPVRRDPGRGYELSAATLLWDYDAFYELAETRVQALKDQGGLRMLPSALSSLTAAAVFGGKLSTAASLVSETQAVIEATGSTFAPYGAAQLAGWRGEEAVLDSVVDQALAHRQGMSLKYAQSATVTLHNGQGDYARALAAAQQADRDPPHWASDLTLHELVEAATRCEERSLASRAVEQLATATQVAGTDWALGIEARSRALVSEGETAESLYREAVERLERSPVRAEAARGHLLYGEWLRRENRRVDAREQLRAAHESFIAMGAEAFVDRAGRELAATGETVRKRTVDTRDELTAEEAQIARLAAEGRTNSEIGAALFLSVRTIEWHLRKVYPKLGISSRRELRAALPRSSRAESSA